MSTTPVIISVIGSLNVDLVTRTPRVPVGGETLTASSFTIGWGGKGANQAVACARLSRSADHRSSNVASDIEVRMVGAVGYDEFHEGFLKALRQDGVNVDGVTVLRGKRTGVAIVTVEESTGQNRIMLSPGANGHVGGDLVVGDEGVVLFQLEVPTDVVLLNMKLAKAKGVNTILNPAPAVPLPPEMYQGLSHLIVNETEASILSEVHDPTDWNEVAAVFISRGVQTVIITLGGEGVFYKTSQQHSRSETGRLVPAKKVEVVDTTAAGDTFAGAYTVAVARWKAVARGAAFDLDGAIAYANRAASVTVQRVGAQSSIPWTDEVPC